MDDDVAYGSPKRAICLLDIGRWMRKDLVRIPGLLKRPGNLLGDI
ncbi:MULTISPECIES: hypothetical protein [Paraburkholderia]|nr:MULTISPECIES: hypothetical protein [Paraburkholderia]